MPSNELPAMELLIFANKTVIKLIFRHNERNVFKGSFGFIKTEINCCLCVVHLFGKICCNNCKNLSTFSIKTRISDRNVTLNKW